MSMHPSNAHFLVNDRIGDISRQMKQIRLAQKVKATGQGEEERLIARLWHWLGFGSGAERRSSRPELVKPLKPEEQCC